MYRYVIVIVATAILAGCGGGTKAPSASSSPAEPKEKSDAEVSEGVKPNERSYIDAAKPFIAAIASRKYDAAFTHLSSHAKARASLNQFNPAKDDAKFAANEKSPITNISAAKFSELMQLVEKEHGRPLKMSNLHVHTIDAKALAGSRNSAEEALDAMFAIGAMPDSIPAKIRKASLRVHIKTELSDTQMAEAAKDSGVSIEELKKNPDFDPYFTLKVVLVEEDGLKVGYFEFLPPSMLD